MRPATEAELGWPMPKITTCLPRSCDESTMSRLTPPPLDQAAASDSGERAEDGRSSGDTSGVPVSRQTDSDIGSQSVLVTGRDEIEAFLTRKWNRKLDHRHIKELSASPPNQIAVQFSYEFHDDSGQWFRTYVDENWQLELDGLMRWRFTSICEHPIREDERDVHCTHARHLNNCPA